MKGKRGNELASKNPPLDVAFQHHLPHKYYLRQKYLHKDRQGTQLSITIFYIWLFAEDACGVTLSDIFGIHTYLHRPAFKSYNLAGLRWKKSFFCLQFLMRLTTYKQIGSSSFLHFHQKNKKVIAQLYFIVFQTL